jgi:hypothetical protein
MVERSHKEPAGDRNLGKLKHPGCTPTWTRSERSRAGHLSRVGAGRCKQIEDHGPKRNTGIL